MTHYRSRAGFRAIGLACLATSFMVAGVAAADEVQQLRDMVDSLRSEVDVLRAEQQTDWMSEQRAEAIRELVQDVLADADTRSSLQGSGMSAGYDGGFFIQSGDDSFKLKFNGQLQTRWLFNHRNTDNPAESGNSYGFEVRRFKLKFSGHVIDPSWQYKMTIVNTRNAQVGGSAGFYSEDAWIMKTMDNGVYMKVGQFKAPFLREELVSSSAQLAVERSMINNAFTYGWTQGLEFGWANDNLSVKAMYSDGPNSLNGQALNDNSENSLTARAELLLAGDWGQFKSLSGYGNTEFGAMIGAAFQWYNYNEPSSVAEYGNVIGRNNYGFTVDASVNGNGWTAFTYFVWGQGRNDDPIYVSDSVDSWGWVIQGGMMPMKDVELFSRYELGNIEDYTGLAGQDGSNSTLTVGANWWPAGKKNVKFTADFGYAFDNLANGPGDNAVGANPTNPGSADWVSSGTGWDADFDDNDGQFLIRAQMQLLF